RRSPGPRAWTSLRGTRAGWSAGHGGGWSAPSRPWVGLPLNGRGLVRHFTTVAWSAPSRARVGPPLHGRSLVRPFTDAGLVRHFTTVAWSATSRTRVGPSPSGAGVGAAAAGDGRAPRALPAYPVGRAARLREGVRPGDVGEPGQPGSGSGTVRRRSRGARAARVALTGREPAAAFLLVGPLPGGGDGVHDGAWHATTPSGSAGRVVDAQPDLFLQPPQAGVQRVAHGLLARVVVVVEEGQVHRDLAGAAADPGDLEPAAVAALLAGAPLQSHLVVPAAQQGRGVVVGAVLVHGDRGRLLR